jgi:uracil-DNA glycosylase family 4
MAHLHPHRSDDDQIFQKYLDRAIGEINDLAAEIEDAARCEHGTTFAPVLGTGHPLADIALVKHRPRSDELEAGVAFSGRCGEAVIRAAARLQVDALDLYGTNCVKCGDEPDPCMLERCPGWLRRELAIVEPKLVVVMGREALLAVNALAVEGSAPIVWAPGELQPWTHACEVLVCPDLDDCLDVPAEKTAFWRAFRTLGDWYADRPPF